MSLTSFLASIGPEVEDAGEEAFLLFSREIPSANLGFIDSRATTLDVTIHDRDFAVHQSPTLLSSKRAGGTTGAVLWKITPVFAEWISSTSASIAGSNKDKDNPNHDTLPQSGLPSKVNPLWTHSILTPFSTVVELGCGISGLVALALAPHIRHYIATDQEYVQKLLRENLHENVDVAFRGSLAQTKGNGKGKEKRNANANAKGMTTGRRKYEAGALKSKSKSKSKSSSECDAQSASRTATHNITFTSLDWEVDIPDTLKERSLLSSDTLNNVDFDNGHGDANAHGHDDNDAHGDDDADGDGPDRGFDLVISCDCIYNDALIDPFVRTCADICRLRPVHHIHDHSSIDSYRKVEQSPKHRRTRHPCHRQPTVCVIAQQQRSPEVFEAWLEATLKEFRVWRVDDEMLNDGLKSGSGYVVHVLVLRDGGGHDFEK